MDIVVKKTKYVVEHNSGSEGEHLFEQGKLTNARTILGPRSLKIFCWFVKTKDYNRSLLTHTLKEQNFSTTNIRTEKHNPTPWITNAEINMT